MISKHLRREPIALVGSGCRFPGPATSPSKLWNLLRNPYDIGQEIPRTRFNVDGFYHPDGDHHSTTNVRRSYFLQEDHRLFDATFFNIHPREAEALDPQQRLLLEVVYEALDSAGFTIEGMQGSDTAVYVGSMCYDFKDLVCTRDPASMPVYTGTGTAPSIFANRVSYFFDWKGPSMTIDTACSSSLAAVHQAVNSLRNGESNVAVAAGVSLILGPETYIAESSLHMLSPIGRSQMWDADADGYGRGEGFAAVILKTLSQALTDGDHIECIIRETALGQDGRTQGITMPGAESQASLIRRTYERAGLNLCTRLDRPQYFEAHGTGTQAGDPVEAEAVHKAFFGPEQQHLQADPLHVGSIKTVTGHLEGTAGLAGILKASLAIRNGVIPPNMHFNTLNPKIEPFYGPLRIPEEQIPWPQLPPGCPRRASVNSFGFGGLNGHCILESYPEDLVANKTNEVCNQLLTPLVVSAKSAQSLTSQVQELLAYLEACPTSSLGDLLWTLQSRRSLFKFRAAFSGASRKEIMASMTDWLQTRTQQSMGPQQTQKGCTLGIFTGQGAQWAGMGSDLIQRFALAKQVFTSLEESLSELPDAPSWLLTEELLAAPEQSRLSEAVIAQPLCTAVQIVLVDLLRAAGIRFGAVIGHSSGEIVAAYAAGFISAHDAIRIAYYRGLYAHLARGREGRHGSMMAVGMSYEDANLFCGQDQFDGRISVAASNAPSSTTLSGDIDAIEAAKLALEKQKIFARLLKVDTAYHSYHMQCCVDAYVKSLNDCDIKVLPGRSDCAWVSSVFESGILEDPHLLGAEYWKDNMACPVLFSQALEHVTSLCGPFEIVVEVGPHPALKGPALETLSASTDQPIPYSGTLDRKKSGADALSELLAFAWKSTNSLAIDFDSYRHAIFGSSHVRSRVVKDLPAYSWDHETIHWKESRVSRRYTSNSVPFHELLGSRRSDDTDEELRWRNLLSLRDVPWIGNHQVQGQAVIPGAAYIVMALEAAQAVCPVSETKYVEMLDLHITRALIMDETSNVEILCSLTRSHEKPDKSQITATFACSSGAADGSPPERMFHCKIVVHLGKSSQRIFPAYHNNTNGLADLDTDQFYDSLNQVGLEYSGMFRSLSSIESGEHTAISTAWRPASKYLVHPSLLDLALQTLLASLGSRELWSPLVPYHIRRIRVDSGLCQSSIGQRTKMSLESTVTSNSVSDICGDSEIYNDKGELEVQFEAISCKYLGSAVPSDDRSLFTTTVWESDISDGSSIDIPEEPASEIELADICERVALFYYRTLKETFAPEEIARSEWHHTRLFEFIDHILGEIRRGLNPLIQDDWWSDTHQDILKLMDAHLESADLQLMRAVGENLPRVIRERTPILEFMMEEGRLSRYYEESLAIGPLYSSAQIMIKRIVHRYPRMNILEVGAGTGGATRKVIEATSGSFSSYCFTDLSAGFFERAQESFETIAHKMTFKTLDAERDPVDQGFDIEKYDLIIGSVVLHATKCLRETLSHIRRLLKPGGYLLLIEGTGNLLTHGFAMCGLAGWWLGAEDDRKWSPMVGTDRWRAELKACGFSGIDALAFNSHDPKRHAGCTFVAQAVDSHLQFLRAPLKHLSDAPRVQKYAILGGKAPETLKLRGHIASRLTPWCNSPILAESLDTMDMSIISSKTPVLLLTEIDEPVFKSLSPTKFEKLQQLLTQANQVLIVIRTDSADAAYSNMLIGLCRSIRQEMPHHQLQVMKTDEKGLDHYEVAGAFMRLVKMLDKEPDSLLYSIEPETLSCEGKSLIPRIIPDQLLNDRLNSQRRLISTTANLLTDAIEIVQTQSSHTLNKKVPVFRPAEDEIVIHMHYSMLQLVSVAGTRGYLGLGQPAKSDERFIVLSRKKNSITCVPRHSLLDVEVKNGSETEFLMTLSCQLLAQNLLRDLPPLATIMIEGGGEILRTAILQEAKVCRCRAVFVSSDSSTSSPDTVFVHPQASHRQIKQTFADHKLKRFASFSDQDEMGTTIRACFPKVAHFDTITDGAGDEAEIQSPEVRSALLMALSKVSHLDPVLAEKDSAKSVIFAGSIASASPDARESRIVDWRKDETVTVEVNPLDTSKLFSRDKTYLLVGLTSDLGQSICRWMVRQGARYIVLTSRHPLLEQGWLDNLKEMGATIHVCSLDVSERQALHSLYADISKTLPPVAGVANAAMVLRDASFSGMSYEQMDQVLKPKVDGSRYLDELFGEQHLEFFVMFSSFSWVFGNRGQSNYVAANAYMAGLAESRRQRGLAGSVIDLGVVSGVGFVARAGKFFGEELHTRLNSIAITEQEVHYIFAEAIVAGQPDSAHSSEVITGFAAQELTDKVRARAPWLQDSLFSHLDVYADQEEQVVGALGNDDKKVTIKMQLAATSSEDEAITVVTQAFSKKLGLMLQLPTDNVDASIPVVDFGVDSLVAVEIRSWFAKEIGADLPVLNILGGATMTELAQTALSRSNTNGTVSRAESDSADAVSAPLPNPLVGEPLMNGHVPEPNHERKVAASYAQMRMWTINAHDPSPHINNTTWRFDIPGWLHKPYFERAFRQVLQSYDILRVRFFQDEEDETLKQELLRRPKIKLDLRNANGEADIDKEFERIRTYKYDLEKGKTMNATLLSISEERHALILGFHHIVFDMRSLQLFLEELDRTYRQWDLKSISQKFLDFAVMEQHALENGSWDDSVAFWGNEYPQAPNPIPLFDFAKVKARTQMTEYKLHGVEYSMGAELLERVQRATSETKVNNFHLYLSVLQALLASLLNIHDLIIGSVDGNRTHNDFLNTFGPLFNYIPIRFRLQPGWSFSEIAQNTRRTAYAAQGHAQIPFDKILQDVGIESMPATHHPLYQVQMNYVKHDLDQLTMGDLELKGTTAAGVDISYDFVVSVFEGATETRVMFYAQEYLYSLEMTEMLKDAYVKMLEAYLANPSLGIGDVSIGEDGLRGS